MFYRVSYPKAIILRFIHCILRLRLSCVECGLGSLCEQAACIFVGWGRNARLTSRIYVLFKDPDLSWWGRWCCCYSTVTSFFFIKLLFVFVLFSTVGCLRKVCWLLGDKFIRWFSNSTLSTTSHYTIHCIIEVHFWAGSKWTSQYFYLTTYGSIS